MHSALAKRAAYSFAVIIFVLLVGTFLFHYIENYSYIDAFYFMSMLATAQGPPVAPATDLGKIAASIMAFVSVGTVVVALVFLFGPFLGRFLRLEERRLKRDEHILIRRVKRLEKKL